MVKMTLNTICRGSVKKPPLFFLHGFLGMKEDWEEVVSYLQEEYYCILADLPGHGSPLTADFPAMLEKTVQKLGINQCALIGYSMGGRLSLMASQKVPSLFSQVIVLSSHPGLHGKQEKRKRLEQELKWERILKTESLPQFLSAWYEQPLFSSLQKRPELLQQLMEKRTAHNPFALSVALRFFSLAHQTPVKEFSSHLFFLCGEEDLKYRELYRTIVPASQTTLVSQCGHAIHLENPKMCAQALQMILKK